MLLPADGGLEDVQFFRKVQSGIGMWLRLVSMRSARRGRYAPKQRLVILHFGIAGLFDMVRTLGWCMGDTGLWWDECWNRHISNECREQRNSDSLLLFPSFIFLVCQLHVRDCVLFFGSVPFQLVKEQSMKSIWLLTNNQKLTLERFSSTIVIVSSFIGLHQEFK